MKYLVIFKRFEIWLLLAVVGWLVVQAFRAENGTGSTGAGEPAPAVLASGKEFDEPLPGEEGEATEAEKAEASSAIRIEDVDVVESGEGRIVEVTLLARSRSGEEVAVTGSTLRARTERGAPVNHFFEPFQREETILPGEPSMVTVRFWLEAPAEALWLEFQGEEARADLPD